MCIEIVFALARYISKYMFRTTQLWNKKMNGISATKAMVKENGNKCSQKEGQSAEYQRATLLPSAFISQNLC